MFAGQRWLLTIKISKRWSYVGDYNRNVDSSLEGQYFRNLIGVGFFIKPLLQSSPNDKMVPMFTRGALGLCKPIHKSWNHYFVIFGDFFAIWASGETTTHLLHGFTPTNTCPTKIFNGYALKKKSPNEENSNNGCLGYGALECHANIQINWKSFARKDQQKHMFRICCP